MADEIVSLEDRAREKARKAGAGVMGSVNDLCTRKEAIDCAVSVGRTVYDQVADEHGKAFAELERQVTARVRACEARVAALDARRFSARVGRAWAVVTAWWDVAVRRLIEHDMAAAAVDDLPPHTPDDGAVTIPMIREFREWGPESDAWLAGGGVALGPDALNPGPECRRLRCPSTDVLRLYAEALGGDPAAIEEGETSKAVTGDVLADCRRLVAGEVLKREDTKPELVT